MRTVDSPPDAARAPLQLVCFLLRGQTFALPISMVKETISARPLTRVPLCAPCVAGLINLRSDVVAVLDLGLLLGLPPATAPGGAEERRIVLLRSARGARGHGARCGLLVDRLCDAQRVPAGALRPAPPALLGRAAAFLSGTARAPGDELLLLLLDPERLLSCDELLPYRQGGGDDATPRSER